MTTTVVARGLPPDTMSHAQVRAAEVAFKALEAIGVEVVACAYESFWWKLSTQKIYGPSPFIWGRVLKVHEVGPYSIVEFKSKQSGNVSDADYLASEPNISFSIFIDGWRGSSGWFGSRDVGHSYGSLDAALVACVVKANERRHRGINEALNESATTYIMRMIGAGREDDD